MINASLECDFGRLERVVGGERDVQVEDATLVDTACGSEYGAENRNERSLLDQPTSSQSILRSRQDEKDEDSQSYLSHSYKLSPFGPALQFGGGSSVISASSFCIRLADVLKALLYCFLAVDCLMGFVTVSTAVWSLPLPPDDGEDEDEDDDGVGWEPALLLVVGSLDEAGVVVSCSRDDIIISRNETRQTVENDEIF